MHAGVARRLLGGGAAPALLDVGCGDGELARHLLGRRLGRRRPLREMRAHARRKPTVAGDATALPFADGSFGSVALLYVLYHLADPRRRAGGGAPRPTPGGPRAVAVRAAPTPPSSRTSSRGGAHVRRQVGAGLVAASFAAVEVERWDAPLLDLPTRADVRDYLVGKGVEAARAARAAEATGVPLTVTKRGALVFGRRA